MQDVRSTNVDDRTMRLNYLHSDLQLHSLQAKHFSGFPRLWCTWLPRRMQAIEFASLVA